MREVPFFRPSIGPEEEHEVIESLRSGWITTGPKAKRFETELAKYVGAKHALAVSHCTGALHLALWALGIGPGDEVITTPFTFTATAEVLGYLGAKPVFVDVDPGTFNINPARIEEALESGRHKRVKAIEPVHFAGQPCDMDRILAIARRHNLKIVEDAAHAIGAARHMEGRGMTRIGTIGDVTCFSFYATKNITTAEGGAIMTEDATLAEKIQVASLHGMNKDAWKRYDKTGSWFYEIHDTGFKYNLSDVHAAIGLAQLKKCDQFMQRRTEVARAFSEAFRGEDALQVPYVEPGVEHAWHLYVLRLHPERLRVGRNQFVEMLRERGVGTSVHCIPLHTMDFYQKTYGYRAGEFPVTEDIFSRCLSLPIYAAMSADDVSYVIETVRDLVRENKR
jgi:dTDP-4-amino-4,6-dideoxygalactose transaminase